MNAAEFKAERECCGLSQADVADALGVRPLTVKRWESGYTPVPSFAAEWVGEQLDAHYNAVADALEAVESQPDEAVVWMRYRRTGEPGAGVANARTREVCAELRSLGRDVRLAYADEEADE